MVEWFKQVRRKKSIDVHVKIHHFAQGFFNSSEIFLRRAGDRLFVSSRSTDLSSFFE
jgi:hypothetical protein